MKRKSWGYIFLFNATLVGIICICVIVYTPFANIGEEEIRASFTSPLISASSVTAPFCDSAKAAVLIDAKSGAVLFEKNAHTPLPMASTTKIMTALSVIENASPEALIQVSPNAASVEGSSIYLREGEKIKVIDLLYGLLLESGNDAATALAEGVFGSVEKCCEHMNERAHEMGLVSTHFENPHGLDGENHYTTAYELAIITKYAMKNELFRRIVSTKNYTSKGETIRYFSNHNRLLNTYPDAVGVKTGYTSKSGRCLVTAANRNGEEYIAVTLSNPLDWQDHKKMHEFAFSNFEGYEIASKDTFLVMSGFSGYIPFEDIYITTSGEADFKVNYKVTSNKDGARVEFGTDNANLGSFTLVKKSR